MKNKIISIGFLGVKKCYLNISEEEAIKRYIESEDLTIDEFNDEYRENMKTIEFNDEFECYDVW